MLYHGRLPLNAAENDAVETLITKHRGEQVSLTRRDPGDTGPLLVHVGHQTWQISANGRARKVTRAT